MKVQNKYNLQWESLLFTILVLVYFIGFLFPLLFTACENVQIASVLYPDEGRYVKVIRGALEAKTLRIHFVSYGHFFFNLVLIPLLFLQQFFTITDVHILLSLRMISWVFGLGSVVWVYIISKRFLGVGVAWLSAILLLIVSLTFIEYSTVAHPDTLQLFFILGSLYYTCLLAEGSEKLEVRYLMWASTMAGLAFSAKYAGILLLPLIAFVFLGRLYQVENLEVSEKMKGRVKGFLGLISGMCLIGGLMLQRSVVTSLFSADGVIESEWIWNIIAVTRTGMFVLSGLFAVLYYFLSKELCNSKLNVAYFIVHNSILAVSVFSLAFVISSPNSLFELQFLQGLIYEGHNTRTGGFFTANWQQIGEQWYRVLTSKYLLGQGLLWIGLGASIGYLYKSQ